MPDVTAQNKNLPTDVDDLTGQEKAAILLMSLGSEAAAELTRHLSDQEVEQLSFEIARIEQVPGDLANQVLEEWSEVARAASSLAEGGVDYAREILEKAVGGRKAESVLGRIKGQLSESVHIQNLRNADSQQLGSMLRDEHPQTIALVLAHLAKRKTAEVLQEIDPEVGGEVLYRMASMDKVSPEVLDLVGEAFTDETEITFAGDMSRAGGPEPVADILNHTPSSLEKQLLGGVEERDAELSEEIKSLMFVFDDLHSLDDRSMQRLMREVQVEDLAKALKVSDESLEERIKDSMTNRAQQSLEEEMEFMGPVRVTDVENAQQKILSIARELEEQGEIIISTDEDALVE
ncbi:MAG: flagellar motor switch protein FliG [Candidatus Palauibacterales bacterium]|nr:flagellar motor switch protein FliG [Candidatus Palauibacterales bacterium]